MQDALQRLYKTKLVLAAVIAVAVGAVLLFLAHWVAARPQLHVLRDLPIADVGSALFTSGLIAIFFEYLDQRDAELRAMQRLRTVLKEEAPARRSQCSGASEARASSTQPRSMTRPWPRARR